MKNNTFRTIFEIKSKARPIGYNHRLVSAGSCFSAEIGMRMKRTGFDILVNPFGISFHPLAINNMLRRALGMDLYKPDDLVRSPDGYVSYDFHGSFAGPSPKDVLDKLNGSVQKAGEYLRAADTLMLTWGTAWGYRVEQKEVPVNNCHKMPAHLFEKVLASPDHLVRDTLDVLKQLKSINPNIVLELTVSPVRHLRDGTVENNRSKAHLLTAVHELCSMDQSVFYFPAFELVMDDLRDYRFFKTDRMHPTDEATDYVWQRYRESRMDMRTAEANEKIENLAAIFRHQPADVQAHQQAIESATVKINELLKPWGRSLSY